MKSISNSTQNKLNLLLLIIAVATLVHSAVVKASDGENEPEIEGPVIEVRGFTQKQGSGGYGLAALSSIQLASSVFYQNTNPFDAVPDYIEGPVINVTAKKKKKKSCSDHNFDRAQIKLTKPSCLVIGEEHTNVPDYSQFVQEIGDPENTCYMLEARSREWINDNKQYFQRGRQRGIASSPDSMSGWFETADRELNQIERMGADNYFIDTRVDILKDYEYATMEEEAMNLRDETMALNVANAKARNSKCKNIVIVVGSNHMNPEINEENFWEDDTRVDIVEQLQRHNIYCEVYDNLAHNQTCNK